MEFELIRKKIKNMYLRVKDGKVIVTAPPSVPFSAVELFVKAKEEWIKKVIIQQSQHQDKKTIDDRVCILGKWYFIQVGNEFKIEDNIIYVNRNYDTQSQIKRFLRSQLEKIGKQYFTFYYEQMQAYFQLPKLKFSYLKGKWGVCYPHKAEIVLSYDLIHCHLEFIAYVVLHELAHMVHPNHSKNFYYFVERYMPNYKQVIKNEKNMV